MSGLYPKWEEVASAFIWDGSWRDIYVQDMTYEDWEKVIAYVKANHEFNFGKNVAVTFPDDLLLLFPSADRAIFPSMHIIINGITIVLHFFGIEILELDIDPSEITCEDDVINVLAFMRELGRVTNKEVLLTPENRLSTPLYVYNKDTDSFVKIADYGEMV